MESNKTPIAPIELTVSHKNHPLLNHLVRLALRMREHGWLGSKCLTYEMESPQRIRVEYSINASVYHKRLVVVAEQEKIKVVNTNPTHFKPVGAIVDAVTWDIKELHTNILGWSDIPQSLKQAMLLLIANDAPLGAEWLDHPLKGEWADHRECHIGGDFLQIYHLEGQQINFLRAGTHAELFEA